MALKKLRNTLLAQFLNEEFAYNVVRTLLGCEDGDRGLEMYSSHLYADPVWDCIQELTYKERDVTYLIKLCEELTDENYERVIRKIRTLPSTPAPSEYLYEGPYYKVLWIDKWCTCMTEKDLVTTLVGSGVRVLLSSDIPPITENSP